MDLRLSSGAFRDGAVIPPQFTCDGEDSTPPLTIHDVPDGAKSLALIMDDPDSPTGVWDHWILFNIPPDSAKIHPTSGLSGKNTWGDAKYGGPCPGQGEHRYFFKLYALDTMLPLLEGATKKEVLSAMEGHVLATAALMGRYKRVGR